MAKWLVGLLIFILANAEDRPKPGKNSLESYPSMVTFRTDTEPHPMQDKKLNSNLLLDWQDLGESKASLFYQSWYKNVQI